jgi:phosphoglycerate dehydrogenase-like enzyme
MTKIAVLNDYQNVALSSTDWGVLPRDAEVTVFNEALPPDLESRVTALQPFDIITCMRERTAFPRALLEKLPNLKLLVTTGMRNGSFDMQAAKDLGVTVCGTGGAGSGTSELTWGLIIALARSIVKEDIATRQGHWETTVGVDLLGHTLGCMGLGNLGSRVAKVGLAFGMNVIAWSQNLTQARCDEVGVKLVSKDELMSQSDWLSVHLVLSDRTRGLIGAAELAQMKPTAYLINTSRGPIVDRAALLDALQNRRIAGAGLDVFDYEPVEKDDPFLKLDNTVITPHLGFVTQDSYRAFYRDTVESVDMFLKGTPVRVINA